MTNGTLKMTISPAVSGRCGFSSFRLIDTRKLYSILKVEPDLSTVGQILDGIGSCIANVFVKLMGPDISIFEVI